MLPSLRITVGRALPRYARPFTSRGTNRDSETLDEALGIFGASDSSSTSVAPPPPPPLTSQTPIEKYADISFYDIPAPNDPLLQFLKTSVMRHGNGAKASKTVTQCLLHIHAFTRAPPTPIVREAILKASPAVKTITTTSRNGKVMARPQALSERQRTKCGIQWIMKQSETKPGSTHAERLAREIIAVVEGNSEVLKKKMEQHKFAMVNRGSLLRIV